MFEGINPDDNEIVEPDVQLNDNDPDTDFDMEW